MSNQAMFAQMKNEDRKYGEHAVKTISAKDNIKRQKHRTDFKNMKSSDFAKMTDDYGDADE